MHAEQFSISPEAADTINNAQRIVLWERQHARLETATRNNNWLATD